MSSNEKKGDPNNVTSILLRFTEDSLEEVLHLLPETTIRDGVSDFLERLARRYRIENSEDWHSKLLVIADRQLSGGPVDPELTWAQHLGEDQKFATIYVLTPPDNGAVFAKEINAVPTRRFTKSTPAESTPGPTTVAVTFSYGESSTHYSAAFAPENDLERASVTKAKAMELMRPLEEFLLDTVKKHFSDIPWTTSVDFAFQDHYVDLPKPDTNATLIVICRPRLKKSKRSLIFLNRMRMCKEVEDRLPVDPISPAAKSSTPPTTPLGSDKSDDSDAKTGTQSEEGTNSEENNSDAGYVAEDRFTIMNRQAVIKGIQEPYTPIARTERKLVTPPRIPVYPITPPSPTPTPPPSVPRLPSLSQMLQPILNNPEIALPHNGSLLADCWRIIGEMKELETSMNNRLQSFADHYEQQQKVADQQRREIKQELADMKAEIADIKLDVETKFVTLTTHVHALDRRIDPIVNRYAVDAVRAVMTEAAGLTSLDELSNPDGTWSSLGEALRTQLQEVNPSNEMLAGRVLEGVTVDDLIRFAFGETAGRLVRDGNHHAHTATREELLRSIESLPESEEEMRHLMMGALSLLDSSRWFFRRS
ncbi:hypothetical protein BJ508DRAFT_329130 [Ascobolus immersus RN42]|uniref:Uncharacterized protein n=1 Tax=Ascobolus immersus RN42 TaxID=1160509 RepID=A0A3N4I9R7_ASCIM|nr:hypothetical protein BJ508DRAFT_329130 [Ascobolus immersus RN42]